MKIDKKEITFITILVCLILFLFFYKLWGFSLFDVDEPRYAEAAREMIESNNWITPYFNYVVRFDKPVFFYWLIAISYNIFGVSEFAARLPSAIMASLVVIVLYIFGRKHVNYTFGFICSLVTLTSLQFIGLARMSITDMTLSAFTAFMLLTGFTAAHAKEPEKKYWWYAFYIFVALGVLTKGPVVGAFAVIVLGPYFILTGKFMEVLKSCQLAMGILLFILVAAPWYILVIAENGQPYIDQFFLTDNLKRFTSTVSGHKAPFYFFFIVVLGGFFPWSAFLPYSLVKTIKSIWNGYVNKEDDNTGAQACPATPGFCPFVKLYECAVTPIVNVYKNADIEKQIGLFAFIWFITIFTLFSVSGTKLLTYILPLFPALGIMVGQLWYDYIEKDQLIKNKWMVVCYSFLGIAILVLSYLIVFNFNLLMPRDAKVLNISEANNYLAILLTISTITGLILLCMKQKAKAFISIIVIMVLTVGVVLEMILPNINNAAQGHLNKIVKLINHYPEKNNEIITYGLVKPSIVFYSKRKVKLIEPVEQELLEKTLNRPKRIFIITRVKFLDELSQKSNVYIIDKGNRFALITNRPYDKKIIRKYLLGEGQ